MVIYRASKEIEFSFDSFHQLKTGKQSIFPFPNSTTSTGFFFQEFLKKSDHLMILFHFFLCKKYNSYFFLISGKFVQKEITEKNHNQKKNRILDVAWSKIHMYQLWDFLKSLIIKSDFGSKLLVIKVGYSQKNICIISIAQKMYCVLS